MTIWHRVVDVPLWYSIIHTPKCIIDIYVASAKINLNKSAFRGYTQRQLFNSIGLMLFSFRFFSSSRFPLAFTSLFLGVLFSLSLSWSPLSSSLLLSSPTRETVTEEVCKLVFHVYIRERLYSCLRFVYILWPHTRQVVGWAMDFREI